MSKLKINKIFSDELILLVFLISMAILMHFLISWVGFNPTDDGIVLANARRILDGQVPHRDFISVRPIGSAIFNLPIVAFGGDYTFWISRFFFLFKFAIISWSWVLIIKKKFKLNLNIFEGLLWGIIVFTFSSHNFPMIISATVDALFFVSLGFLICIIKEGRMKFLGYFLIGVSYLCKQSFIVIGPLTIFFLKDFLDFQAYAGFLTPAVFYLFYLLLNGALTDFVSQVSSHTDFIRPGIDRYLRDNVFYSGIIVGMILFFLIYLIKKINNKKEIINFKEIMMIIIVFGIIFGVLFYNTISLNKDCYIYMQSPSFFLFSVVSGMIIFLILRKLKNNLNYQLLSLGLFILLLSWTVSISIGYNSPALATGILALFLLASGKLTLSTIKNTTLNRLSTILTVVIACLALKNNILGRRNYVYRDKPVKFLNKSIDRIILGTKNIKTNENTYNFLLDLQNLINKSKRLNRDYIIIPDLAAYWAKSRVENPLPVDWLSTVEIGNAKNSERLMSIFDRFKGNKIVIMQKVSVAWLPVVNKTLDEAGEDSKLLQYVRKTYKKIDETKYFEIYN